MRNPRFTRRAALAGLGCASLGAFVPLLDVEAERGGIPKRLILFYHPFGTFIDAWRPQGTVTDFTFGGSITAPLEPHKSDLVVIEGLGLRYDSEAIPGDPHQAGMALLWSGAAPLNCDDPNNDGTCLPEGGQDGTVGWGGGITVDQYLADRLAPDTAFRSLELAVDTYADNIRARMCYRGPGQPLMPEIDPVQAYANLFGDFSGDDLEVQRLMARRKSTLDLVGKRLDALRDRVSAHDRLKIEAHLDAVTTIESQLQGLGACMAPSEGPMAYDPHDSSRLMEIGRAQIDLMVAALACDRTRIASLQIKDEDGGNVAWLDPNATNFHALSHNEGDWETLMPMAYRDFTSLFAYLLEKLAATPMGDGTRLLDHTLVAWGSAMGSGSHEMSPVPFVLAGGCQGYLQTGRYLTYDEGTRHQRLLVSILDAMGVDEESFGAPWDDGAGPLPGLV